MLRLGAGACAWVILTAVGAAARGSAGEQAELQGSSSRPATEIEAGVAVGEASGAAHFGCSSQQTRVRYVVGAAEVRHSARSAAHPSGAGFTLLGGAAVAVAGEQVVSRRDPDLPGDGVAATWAAHARVGHHDRWIGAEGGIGIVHKWPEASTRDSWVLPYPDVRVSVGPRNVFHGFIGIGNSQPSSIAVAVPYAGLAWWVAPRLRLEGRFALELVHGSSQYRGDLACWARVAPRWFLGAGVGLGRETNQYALAPPSGEGNLGVVFVP